MRNQPNRKTVGAFILAGIVGFVIITSVLLGFGLRREKNMYVMYFHESINGLAVGAPVVFSGVEVGKVAKIEIVPNIDTYKFNIPVYVIFKDIEKTISVLPGRNELSEEKILAEMIERGLYARLIKQNLLTGSLMIELDMRPAKTRISNIESDYIEIPTALSSMTELSANVQDMPLRAVMDNLNHTLTEVREVLTPVAKIGNDLAKKSGVTLNNFNQAVQDVSRAANSLRNLAEFLEQHPESLIRGR